MENGHNALLIPKKEPLGHRLADQGHREVLINQHSKANTHPIDP